MASATDWVTLAPAIAAAAGVGTIVGSAITTYGGRGREQREARSRALDCLEKLEVLRTGMSEEERINSSFVDLPEFRQVWVSCMVARVPRSVVDTYGKICDDARWRNLDYASDRQVTAVVSAVLLDRAARLVRDALYHARLARTVSWWRMKVSIRKSCERACRGPAWRLAAAVPVLWLFARVWSGGWRLRPGAEVFGAGVPGQEAFQRRAGEWFPAVAAAFVEVSGEPGQDVQPGHPGGRGDGPDDGGVPGGVPVAGAAGVLPGHHRPADLAFGSV